MLQFFNLHKTHLFIPFLLTYFNSLHSTALLIDCVFRQYSPGYRTNSVTIPYKFLIATSYLLENGRGDEFLISYSNIIAKIVTYLPKNNNLTFNMNTVTIIFVNRILECHSISIRSWWNDFPRGMMLRFVKKILVAIWCDYIGSNWNSWYFINPKSIGTSAGEIMTWFSCSIRICTFLTLLLTQFGLHAICEVDDPKSLWNLLLVRWVSKWPLNIHTARQFYSMLILRIILLLSKSSIFAFVIFIDAFQLKFCLSRF